MYRMTIQSQLSENYDYISQKDSQGTKTCLLLKLFSPQVSIHLILCTIQKALILLHISNSAISPF